MSIRAPALRRFAGSGEGDAFAATTRLEPRERERYAASLAESLRSLSPARAHPERCARGVPARASPCLLAPFVVDCSTPGARASWGPKPESPISAVTTTDARAHPYEPLILLRARLPPLSAFDGADPAYCRADAIVPSVISAWARSHALCDPPCGRSLDRRSREVPLSAFVRRHYAVGRAGNEPGEVRSVPATGRHATWVAAPKRRLTRRFPPDESPPSSTADTPCRLVKARPRGRFSPGGPVRPGGRPCFREDLGLELRRLREENAVADGQGAWNPT